MTEQKAPARRRTADLSGRQAAVLEGRINVLEEKIANVDHKVDGLAGQMTSLDTKVDLLKDSMIAQQAERSAFLEAFKLVADGRAVQAPPAPTDTLQEVKKRVFVLMQIAVALMVTLYAALQIDRTLLSPQASKEAHEIGHAAAP